MMKSILHFLFGKMPDIFSQKGEVEHTRNSHSWSQWKRRYINGSEYNWKQHEGMRNNPANNSLKKPQTSQ